MRQVTINYYSFDELSEEAKEKAVQNLSNIDFDWFEVEYEDIKNVGEALGIVFAKQGRQYFYFDLDKRIFSAMASLDFHDMVKNWRGNKLKEYAPNLIKEFSEIEDIINKGKRILKWDFAEIYGNITDETFEYWIETYNSNGNDSSNVDDFTEEIGQDMKELMHTFANWALNKLRRQYEYLTSEEAIIESIKANEYEFTEDGELV